MTWRQLLLPDTAPLRESPSFRLLWIGQLISLSGSQLRLVALPYQIFVLTGSSFAVGLIGVFQAVPLLLLSLFALPGFAQQDFSKVEIRTEKLSDTDTVDMLTLIITETEKHAWFLTATLER